MSSSLATLKEALQAAPAESFQLGAVGEKKSLTSLPTLEEMVRDGLEQLEKKHPVRQLCDDQLWTVKTAQVLGEGKDGTVYVACRQNECEYAVKRMECVRSSNICFAELVWSTLAGRWNVGPEVHDARICPHVQTALGLNPPKVMMDVFMDRLSGATLFEWLRRARQTSDDYALVGDRLANQVQTMHDKGMVHNDLFAVNVFVEQPSLRVKMIDFRLAAFVGAGRVTDMQHESDVETLCDAILRVVDFVSDARHAEAIRDFALRINKTLLPAAGSSSSSRSRDRLTRQTASGNRFGTNKATVYSQSADDSLASASVDLERRRVAFAYRRDKVADVAELRAMLAGVCRALQIEVCDVVPL
jgi:tRNA A-37 threonylcarbamoyl transferase component Bud32